MGGLVVCLCGLYVCGLRFVVGGWCVGGWCGVVVLVVGVCVCCVGVDFELFLRMIDLC